MIRRTRQRGMSLVELIVAFSILMMLTGMAVPLARYKVRREREKELRFALREMRSAIDKYKADADGGKLGQLKMGTEGYPETLQSLVDGVKLPGDVDKKKKYLRRILTRMHERDRTVRNLVRYEELFVRSFGSDEQRAQLAAADGGTEAS